MAAASLSPWPETLLPLSLAADVLLILITRLLFSLDRLQRFHPFFSRDDVHFSSAMPYAEYALYITIGMGTPVQVFNVQGLSFLRKSFFLLKRSFALNDQWILAAQILLFRRPAVIPALPIAFSAPLTRALTLC
jgi:hypothetical protein